MHALEAAAPLCAPNGMFLAGSRIRIAGNHEQNSTRDGGAMVLRVWDGVRDMMAQH